MNRLIALGMLRENRVGLRVPDRNSQHFRWIKRSIKRSGMTSALTVREGTDCETGATFYEIIDGHHRFLALKELANGVANCNVVKADDLQVLLLQLRLNKGAESKIRPDELSLGIRRLMMHDPLCTLVQIARDIPMNVQRIERALNLHKIATGAGISNLVRDGKICLMNAYAIAKLPHHEQITWVDRAKCMEPQKFIPACGKREKEISRQHRRARFEDEARGTNNPCGEVTLEPGGKGFDIAPSGFELLHGKPKVQETVEIKYTVEFKEAEPISRKGWDHVRYNERRAYCHGDILVWQSRRWNVKHPTIDCGNEFDDAITAMAWVEEQFA